MNNNRKYGWKKQSLDIRDLKFKHLAKVKNFSDTASLPPSVNNIVYCPPVFNQGDLGSCTANAWAGLLGYNENKSGSLYHDMSRLFIYYNERVINDTINQDSGAQLRDGAKVINQYGVCVETEWPYNVAQFTIKPADVCYTDALPNTIHSYYSLDGETSSETLNNLKTTLANGQCFVFGFQVYDSFESQQVADTGIMPMPNIETESLLGGHAVMGIGYDDATQKFIVRNSWGPDWGLKGNLGGYFMMPYNFISNPKFASDFWTVVKDI